jgi:ABC-2 type transport system permease protein
MRFVWIAALKDLRILRRDPFSVITWVGIPLVIGLLIHAVFGGGDSRPQGLLLVADQDNTIASGLLAGSFSNEAVGNMVTVERVDSRTGRERIDRGDGSALLVIPKGLQDAFLDNRPCHLQLLTNPGQRILPKMIEEILRSMVDGAFYVQRIGGGQIRSLGGRRAVSDQDVSRNSIEVNHLAHDMVKYFSPPLIVLETTVVQAKRNNAGAADLFFPNMIFLALLLMANGLSTDIWKEYSLGTVRRLAVTPASLAAFLGGRLAMVAMVYSAVAVASVLAARYVVGAHVANLAAAAAWAALSGTAFYLLLLPLAVFSSNPRGADVRGNLLVFPLSMLGGCFFPFEVMPDWMARIGRWTPNGLAVVQFKEVLLGTVNWTHLAAVLAGLSVAALLAFLLALRRLRGAFVQ